MLSTVLHDSTHDSAACAVHAERCGCRHMAALVLLDLRVDELPAS